MELEREIETYREILESLLPENLGKFVIIHGKDIIGIMDTYEDALKEGYGKCGLDKPFLVKRIATEYTSMYFTRDVISACQF